MKEESLDYSVWENERIVSKENQEDKKIGVWPQTEDQICFICSYQEKSDFMNG